MKYSAILAALVASVAAKDGRTFAVLRFYGDGPLTECRADPIVQPGVTSSHVHTVMGGSGFSISATAEDMVNSQCSNALIEGDNSAYWFPKLYFHDKDAGTFEPVEMFYMNVYYFFEGTNDEIKAFPVGLQMVTGNALTRVSPGTGDINLDPSAGDIQAVQWTCPRSSTDIPLYPVGSDGSKAGIQDSNNKGAGTGLPFQECDGYASPLRMDLHFPSCYNPAAGLSNYKENMQFPSSAGNGKQDCPEGWIHTPHIFFEVYWNTPKFIDRWTPNDGYQPFVLSEGDVTGFSEHGDFFAGWDEDVLQHIIDTCDAGDSGMDQCPGVTVRDKSQDCHVTCQTDEAVTGVLSALPGNNPLAGWGIGDVSGGSSSGSSSSAAAAAPASSATSAKAETSTTAAKVETSSADAVKIAISSSVAESPSASEEEPAPTTTTVAAAEPTTTTAPSVTIIAEEPSSLSDAGGASVSTVWDTVTVWMTQTVTEDGVAPATATPTAASITGNSSLPNVAGWKYAGCYKDTRTRVIQGDRLPNLGAMSNDKCVTYCQGKGFSLAGTEYGGQCFCGDELVSVQLQDESLCSATCEGDASAVCGGDWSLSVYSTDGTVKSSAAKRHLHNHALHHRRLSQHRRR
ncbi:WSC-domain-containing protein [Pleurostoma richardsiae]|uniref:WSC-domain-containing protein n=1 Tax=Pleurostoma richardsiae TaxID=41990 RepID=A0AA38RX76_9PEZI|nr:WSC-domain-containing protein [Pleurostoma richardsiae]